MKILIIEDGRATAEKLANALSELGEVSTCTRPDPFEVEFEKAMMPPKEEVIHMIENADIILLDDDLQTSYRGRDLLNNCEGKKVLGISTKIDLGHAVWYAKDHLSDDRPHVAESLREKVRSLMK